MNFLEVYVSTQSKMVFHVQIEAVYESEQLHSYLARPIDPSLLRQLRLTPSLTTHKVIPYEDRETLTLPERPFSPRNKKILCLQMTSLQLRFSELPPRPTAQDASLAWHMQMLNSNRFLKYHIRLLMRLGTFHRSGQTNLATIWLNRTKDASDY